MNDDDKAIVEGALIRTALRRLGAMPSSLFPSSVKDEQMGLAFAANDLNFAGAVNYSVHAKLDEIRSAAIHLKGEL